MALKAEIQGFIEKYKLKKSRLDKYIVYLNNDMLILQSGVGIINMQEATITLLKYKNISSNDSLLNIGICGADDSFNIGDVVKIGAIIYKGEKYILDSSSNYNINCEDSEVCNYGFNLVDMESFGFFTASKDIKNRSMYKVVSDHFSPKSIKKDDVKKLIKRIEL